MIISWLRKTNYEELASSGELQKPGTRPEHREPVRAAVQAKATACCHPTQNEHTVSPAVLASAMPLLLGQRELTGDRGPD